MIELRGVSKSYGRATALGRTDLRVEPGDTVVLIGPSGCGKSTVLRLMIGLVAPDEGEVLFEGEVLEDRNARELRTRIGYVIQDGGLFPHLTARENAVLMARHLGWEHDRIEERLAALADLTRFPCDGLDRYPVQLSGGQRQRVSLMRALFLDPALLLLDEPLGALDPMIRADLQHELRQIIDTLGKSVVLVTHDLAEARYFGGRIVLLDSGRIVQEGTFEGLVESPAEPFVTRFVRAQQGNGSGVPGGASG